MKKDVANGDKLQRIRSPIMTDVPIKTFAVAEIPILRASADGRWHQKCQAVMSLGKSSRRFRHTFAVAVVPCDHVL